MKKIFIATLAFLMAVTMGTSLAQIGPSGGGPVGPASPMFRGGTILVPIKAASSTCATPQYSFSESGRDDNGINLVTGSDNLQFCVGGAAAISSSSSAITTTLPVLVPAGTCAAPQVSFSESNRNDNGLSLTTGSDNLDICVGGSARMTATTSAITANLPFNPTTTSTATSGGITSTASTVTDTSSAVVTANDAAYTGGDFAATKTGADTTVGTVTTIAVKGAATKTGQTDAGTNNTYGGYFSATGGTNGTTTGYGVYATATGSDTNYAGYFAGDIYGTTDLTLVDDLSCNQATATVNAIGETKSNPSTTGTATEDGLLLRNIQNLGAEAKTTVNEYSPSIRLDAVGYTAGPTYTRHSWGIYNAPVNATTGRLLINFASNGGAYGNSPLSINASGSIQSYTAVLSSAGYMTMDYGTVFGVANKQYLMAKFAREVAVAATAADAATAIPVRIGNDTTSISIEGGRLSAHYNASALKSSVDKDGVYHQGYASGQVTDAVPSLALTLVTALDDDSIYDLTVGCQYIGYAAGATGTPNYYFSSVVSGAFSRVDGVAAEVGSNTVISHKESDAACVPCTLAAVNGASDSITVTFTQCHLDADTANVKAWIMDMRKTNITAFTGVSQPAAN